MNKKSVVLVLAISACGGALDTSDTTSLVEVSGCDSATLFERPADPAERGPWSVGVRTVSLGRLDVEVLYPALPGTEEGLSPMEVDIRYALPDSERSKVTEDVRPFQGCDCYSDLPLDDSHGPYPLILFVHGTASWRTQSLSLMEHWASRGFVVASADHPGLWLSDILGSVCGLPSSGNQNLLGDLETVLEGFTDGDPALDFISGGVDLNNVAVIGHSAGANTATAASDFAGVRTVISMAGSGTPDSAELDGALFMGGMSDNIVSFDQTEAAFERTDVSRRLLGIAEGGHLIFSDICELTNNEGEDLVQIATEAGVCGAQFASFLFDCDASTIPPEDSRAIVKAASTWELETNLHCDEEVNPFEDFGALDTWIEVLENE